MLRSIPVLVLVSALCSAQAPYQSLIGDAAGDRYGYTLGPLGDVNGDGVPDFVASSGTADINGVDSGQAYVVSGADGSRIHTWNGDGAGDVFGFVVNSAGDIDGDNVPDVVIGAPFDDDAGTNAGRVTLASGANGAILYTIDGLAADDNFGYSAMGIGDVDGDGASDFAVGARHADVSASDSGSVTVFSGATGTILHTLHGDFANDAFGWDVTRIGDLNGDGIGDFIASAPQVNGTGIGYVRIFDGAMGAALGTVVGGAAHDDFGISVRFAGDVNADGTPDFVVGAIQYDFGISQATGPGYVRVVSGASGGALYTFTGDTSNDWMGIACGSAGDVDGDGFGDVVAGACQTFQVPAAPGYGRVHSGQTGAVLYDFDGDLPGDVFGRKVTPAGDLNGDGFDDVIICARKADNNGSSSGIIRVFHLGPLAEPWLDGACGEGAVGFGIGGPLPLLKVAGSDGWVERRVDIPLNAGFDITVDQPAGNPFSAHYVLFGRVGAATPQEALTVGALGITLGRLCFTPCTMDPNNALLFTAASSLSGFGCPLIAPTGPTPVTIPVPGFAFPFTVTMQAFVEEDGVSSVRPTNGVIVRTL